MRNNIDIYESNEENLINLEEHSKDGGMDKFQTVSGLAEGEKMPTMAVMRQ